MKIGVELVGRARTEQRGGDVRVGEGEREGELRQRETRLGGDGGETVDEVLLAGARCSASRWSKWSGSRRPATRRRRRRAGTCRSASRSTPFSGAHTRTPISWRRHAGSTSARCRARARCTAAARSSGAVHAAVRGERCSSSIWAAENVDVPTRADLAGRDELVERGERLVDRRVRVGAVHLVQVDVVDLQRRRLSSQDGEIQRRDRPRSADRRSSGCRPWSPARPVLATATQGLAEDVSDDARSRNVGRVEQRDAGVERPMSTMRWHSSTSVLPQRPNIIAPKRSS